MNYSFFAGPNFSFPVGKVEYLFDFMEEDSSYFNLKTFCSAGFVIGSSLEINIKDFDIFVAVKYLFDFSPIVYEIGNVEEELLIRLHFILGLGANYSF